jgi:hypothetical protein
MTAKQGQKNCPVKCANKMTNLCPIHCQGRDGRVPDLIKLNVAVGPPRKESV